jgi:hypothetical protein
MLNKIVLAGGSGYLGHVLADYYKDKAKEIIVFSRREVGGKCAKVNTVPWDAETRGEWEKVLEGADILVNLCGKNVNCRYTDKAKAEISLSRRVPTELLGAAIAEMANPPKLWINSASATIYRHAEDKPQDEETGEMGAGFSEDVCKTWEDCFWKTKTPGTCKVLLRVGLVMGRSDGAFPRLKRLAALGLGGKQGPGSQYVSWIHEQDFARVTEWLFLHPEHTGVYNCTAPEAIPNKDFMKIIRKAYGVPFGLPSPQWLLEVGAKLIGTETELILKSRWVYPKRLLEEGFRFHFPNARQAVQEILSTRT